MRRYWQPAVLSEEAPIGGPPRPVRLLGEDLVVFRDPAGQIGLLGRRCSHRGADLCYGEVEERGIRCFYHGWLYSTSGQCLEQPLEPADSQFCDSIHHLAYPCVERGGVIFGYLGPDEPPLLPDYEFLGVPEDQRRARRYLVECNYLQATEGSVDPLQLMVFNQVFGQDADRDPSIFGPRALQVETEDSEFGVRIFAARSTASDDLAVEVRDFMLPAISTISGIGIDGYAAHWHVPIDDTHHWRYVLAFRRDGPLTEEDAERNGLATVEDYRLTFDLQDRQQTKANFVAYAISLAESQGPIYDRTQEHLVNTDQGLLAMRTVMHKAIQDVQEGADPLGVVRDAEQNQFANIGAREQRITKDADWHLKPRED
ncbi:MAG TPA: Rieske 2Fe-2S domain-containing protein [Chloroflexota bacterium]